MSSSLAVAKVLILKIMTVIMTINSSSGRIEQRSRGCWLLYEGDHGVDGWVIITEVVACNIIEQGS